MFKFTVGERVKDIITGFVGVIECRTEWLNGCRRYGVRPQKLGKDGAMPDMVQFDEEQLIADGKRLKLPEKAPTGGGKDAIARGQTVSR